MLGLPAEGNVALRGSFGCFFSFFFFLFFSFLWPEGEFNDLPFDPVEISCNFCDEQAIWSHDGVEETALL